MEFEIRYRSDGELVAEAGPLFVRVIDGVETTDESVDRLVAQLENMLGRWPNVALIVLVEHGTPKPAPEVRRRVDAELRRYAERIVIAYAFLGLGFWIADAHEFGAERAAAVGIPVIVEREIPELARRLAFELIGVDASSLAQRLEQLRAALGNRPVRP